MKKIDTLLVLIFCFVVNIAFAQRYTEEVFEEVEIMTDVTYGENITVITIFDTLINAPSLEQLKMDVYQPAGDTETDRPLIISIHDGNYLPPKINGRTIGEKSDSFQVETAMRLAKMGYVVAVIDYREGWNPLVPEGHLIARGMMNAIYRGVQDANTCVRFFRKDIEENGNSFGVCSEKIAFWGNGSGGYIALAASTIDEYNDVLKPKFFYESSGIPTPMIVEAENGNPFGTVDAFTPTSNGVVQTSTANHIGYSSKVALCVNMGGAIADTSWITANDPPMISFQVPTDQIAPYKESILVVHPGTIILEVQGAHTIQSKINNLGLNHVFVDANIQDEFTDGANVCNDGLEGLYPFHRPCPLNIFDSSYPVCESSPWEWWEVSQWDTMPYPNCFSFPIEECNFHIVNSNFNQDMSPEKGRMYIDTIVGYFAPRAFVALNLGDENCVVATQELLDETTIGLTISPNPASTEMRFKSEGDDIIETIEIYDLSGQLIDYQMVNANSFLLKKAFFSKGIFIAKVQFEKGVIAKKIVFN